MHPESLASHSFKMSGFFGIAAIICAFIFAISGPPLKGLFFGLGLIVSVMALVFLWQTFFRLIQQSEMKLGISVEKKSGQEAEGK